MSEPRSDSDPTRESPSRIDESARYPTNRVAAIVDTADQLTSAARALKTGGFLDSEIEVSCGEVAADVLNESSGRTGLGHLAIRLAERLGIQNDEMAVKERYEKALRDDRFVILIAAPTDERKKRAGQILHNNGAYFVNFLGRFAIEVLQP